MHKVCLSEVNYASVTHAMLDIKIYFELESRRASSGDVIPYWDVVG